MRLIDADKLLETYKKWIPQLSSKEDEGDKRGVETCIAVLEDMPTLDAVPVTRCGQCKHWNSEKRVCMSHRNYVFFVTAPDFYCADGERKEADYAQTD